MQKRPLILWDVMTQLVWICVGMQKGNFYVLEINSLPSLGEHGSYVIVEEQVGLDLTALINRMGEVGKSRYLAHQPRPRSMQEK